MGEQDAAPMAEPDPEGLAEMLNAFLEAEPEGKERFLLANADSLLHPAAEAMLRNGAADAEARGEADAVSYFRAHADLLTACREQGVEAVFSGLRQAGTSADSRSDVEDMFAELQGLIGEAERQPSRHNFERLVGLCNQLVQATPRRDAPDLWAALQVAKGNALARLGEFTADGATLQQSEAAFHDALKEFDPDRVPQEWASTHFALGVLLLILGNLNGNVATWRRSVTSFHEALNVFTRERAPLEWAMTQNSLGNVLQRLGAFNNDVETLRQSEAAYFQALLERTRERAPMDWAMTKNNVGLLQQSIGEHSGDLNVLARSIDAFQEALTEYSRERAPIQWAMTQNNLGMALRILGDFAGDETILQKSAAAHLTALTEYTRERAPMQWAMTQNNLGNALSRLADLTGDGETLRHAEVAYREALKEHTRECAPMQWAMTQNNLGGVLARLGNFTGDADTLRESEKAFREALKERTRSRAPTDWATTLDNLGSLLSTLGEINADAETLRMSEASYLEALNERTRDRAPMSWAATQFNLGHALVQLGELTSDATSLPRAEVAYREAHETFAIGGDQDKRQRVAGRLARLIANAGRYAEAAAVIEPAIVASDAALLEASRSAAGRGRTVELVGDLYALLSLCRLRGPEQGSAAALIAAEGGRARLLADAFNFDAVRLEEIKDPEIREKIEAADGRRRTLRRRLGFEQTGANAPTQPLSSDERAQLQAELAGTSETYLSLCREHGLVRTPDPPNLDEIRAAVPSGGALVLPVLTEREAFAFVVTEAASEPAVVDLPHLNRRGAVEHLSGEDRWLRAYDRHFRDYGGKNPAAAQQWCSQLAATMAWLWERLMAPIHIHLRDDARLDRGAPVVLLAPGLLGMLPLHAAGPGPDGRVFGDHWTVSYAPSARALAICRNRAKERSGLSPRLLAVLDPDGSLPGARAEEAMLRRRFEGIRVERTILVGKEATLSAVTERLPTATAFHASTHGHHHTTQPTKSGLTMAGKVELTLEDLRHARLAAARLVFLSACESGLAGVRRLPEEFIGLPTGFVQAGAACVIGSLWPIYDHASYLAAERFYKEWLDEQGRERAQPAAALKAALDWLRNVTYGELKTMFPIESGENGDELVLRDGSRFVNASLDAEPEPPMTPPSDGSKPPPGVKLPLGPDDARPFAHPEYWAAFACTGA
jgi:tetratricopeptide (TPR) repeat protein